MTSIIPPTAVHGFLQLDLLQRDQILVPGNIVENVIHDSNVRSVTPSTTDSAWDIVASAQHLGRMVPVQLSCSPTGSVVNGRLLRVSDGPCVLTAKSGMFIKSQSVTMARQGGQTVHQWQSWQDECLAKAIEATTNVSLPFWRGSGYGFTAISPRHVIGCEHINFMPPTLTLGGVTRNLVNTEYAGPANSADGWKSDLMIGLYDGDFPSFAKVFPSTLFDYLPTLELKGVPAIVCNQFGEKLPRITALTLLSNSKLTFNKVNPTDKDIIGGDSGNPAFLVIGGEPVLLGTLTQGGNGGITTIHDQITAINAAMSTLGGGYQLTTFDLSMFANYA